MRYSLLALCALLAAPLSALAAPKMDSKQPIEIASDTLEVLQEKNQAIFSGNVIAKQGDVTMRSAKMIVYYESAPTDEKAKKADAAGTTGKGIDHIESEGDVVFITTDETAKGDKAIYNTKTDTIDLIGNVVLTREKNILKGSTLNYNLTTGRSVLTGGGSKGRVHGLFVPSGAK